MVRPVDHGNAFAIITTEENKPNNPQAHRGPRKEKDAPTTAPGIFDITMEQVKNNIQNQSTNSQSEPVDPYTQKINDIKREAALPESQRENWTIHQKDTPLGKWIIAEKKKWFSWFRSREYYILHDESSDPLKMRFAYILNSYIEGFFSEHSRSQHKTLDEAVSTGITRATNYIEELTGKSFSQKLVPAPQPKKPEKDEEMKEALSDLGTELLETDPDHPSGEIFDKMEEALKSQLAELQRLQSLLKRTEWQKQQLMNLERALARAVAKGRERLIVNEYKFNGTVSREKVQRKINSLKRQIKKAESAEADLYKGYVDLYAGKTLKSLLENYRRQIHELGPNLSETAGREMMHKLMHPEEYEGIKELLQEIAQKTVDASITDASRRIAYDSFVSVLTILTRKAEVLSKQFPLIQAGIVVLYKAKNANSMEEWINEVGQASAEAAIKVACYAAMQAVLPGSPILIGLLSSALTELAQEKLLGHEKEAETHAPTVQEQIQTTADPVLATLSSPSIMTDQVLQAAPVTQEATTDLVMTTPSAQQVKQVAPSDTKKELAPPNLNINYFSPRMTAGVNGLGLSTATQDAPNPFIFSKPLIKPLLKPLVVLPQVKPIEAPQIKPEVKPQVAPAPVKLEKVGSLKPVQETPQVKPQGAPTPLKQKKIKPQKAPKKREPLSKRKVEVVNGPAKQLNGPGKEPKKMEFITILPQRTDNEPPPVAKEPIPEPSDTADDPFTPAVGGAKLTHQELIEIDNKRIQQERKKFLAVGYPVTEENVDLFYQLGTPPKKMDGDDGDPVESKGFSAPPPDAPELSLPQKVSKAYYEGCEKLVGKFEDKFTKKAKAPVLKQAEKVGQYADRQMQEAIQIKKDAFVSLKEGNSQIRQAAAIKQAIKQTSGEQVTITVNGKEVTLSRAEAKSTAKQMKHYGTTLIEKSEGDLSKGQLQALFGRTVKIGGEELNKQINCSASIAANCLGDALADVATNHAYYEQHPDEAAMMVGKRVLKGTATQVVTSVVDTAAKELFLSSFGQEVGEWIPGVQILMKVNQAYQIYHHSKDSSEVADGMSDMIIDLGISTAVTTVIPVPLVGPFVGNLVSKAVRAGYHSLPEILIPLDEGDLPSYGE